MATRHNRLRLYISTYITGPADDCQQTIQFEYDVLRRGPALQLSGQPHAQYFWRLATVRDTKKNRFAPMWYICGERWQAVGVLSN